MTRARPTFACSWRFDSGHVCAMTFTTGFVSWCQVCVEAELWNRRGWCSYEELCRVLHEVRDVRRAVGASLTTSKETT